MDNNEILFLKYFIGKFLWNVKCIDLLNNRIIVIFCLFLWNLEKVFLIDLCGNLIIVVFSVFWGLFLSICVLKIDVVIFCMCLELWFKDCLMNYDCGDDIGFMCRDIGLSFCCILEFDVCEKWSWYIYFILIFVIILIILIFIVYYFKIEVYFLIRKM